jgi:hypothetical protein
MQHGTAGMKEISKAIVDGKITILQAIEGIMYGIQEVNAYYELEGKKPPAWSRPAAKALVVLYGRIQRIIWRSK